MSVYATKIKLVSGCLSPTSPLEIDEIYLEGVEKEQFYKKSKVHDFVAQGNEVKVKIPSRYPKLQAVTSYKGEKYVRSEPNDTPSDNLLNLHRS